MTDILLYAGTGHGGRPAGHGEGWFVYEPEFRLREPLQPPGEALPMMPALRRDGRKLAWIAYDGLDSTILLCDLAAGPDQAERVAVARHALTRPCSSPDDQRLAVLAMQQTGFPLAKSATGRLQIWRREDGGWALQQTGPILADSPLEWDAMAESLIATDPAGRLVRIGLSETGKAGDPIPLADRGYAPAMDPDGAALAFLADGAVTILGLGGTQRHELAESVNALAWLDSQRLALAVRDGLWHQRVIGLDLDTGEQTLIFETGKVSWLGRVAVVPRWPKPPRADAA